MRVDTPFKIVYEDDTVVEDRIRFADYVAVERYFQLNIRMAYSAHGTEVDLYCAWNALNRRGKLPAATTLDGKAEPIPFSEWLLSVMEYEELKEEGTEVSEEDPQEEADQGEASDLGKAPAVLAQVAQPQ